MKSNNWCFKDTYIHFNRWYSVGTCIHFCVYSYNPKASANSFSSYLYSGFSFGTNEVLQIKVSQIGVISAML